MTFVLPRDHAIDPSMDCWIDPSLNPSTAAPLGGAVVAAGSTTAAKPSSTADANHLVHDTRNWLTVLQMYCDLLRTSGAVASGHRNWIDELSGAVERGQSLVVSLLDSVREANGGDGHGVGWEKAAAVPAALDVADALGRRRELLQRMAGDRIHVEVEADSPAGKVAIEESAFERILYNLAGNAMEAMPDGGRLRLTVRAGGGGARSGDSATTVRLRVCDTGEGIAPERLQKIFEAGVSSKSAVENGRPRRGFGLAIVRELTERAGGTVRVRSHRGQGSCFELEFPAT